MNSFIILLALCHVTYSASLLDFEKTGPGPIKNYTSSDIPSSSLRCGGSITQARGSLTYKRFEVVDSNERCVWVIRSADRNQRIETQTLNLPGSLSVTALGAQGEILEAWIPYYGGDYRSFYNVKVFVITFETGSSAGTQNAFGFSLNYDTDTYGDYTSPDYGWETTPDWWETPSWKEGLTKQSTDIILSGESGYLRYPASGNYGNNEFSTIIITPTENIATENSSYNVIYMGLGLENGYDFVHVYEYNSNATSRWMFLGSINGNQNLEFIRNKDMIMLVFESDGSNTGPGFQITYSHCG